MEFDPNLEESLSLVRNEITSALSVGTVLNSV